jgi:acetyl esterase/lipase
VDPHVRRILEILDETRGQLLPALQSNPAALREMPNRWAADIPEGPPMAVLEDRAIPGPAGDIPLRVFLPHERRGAYLHMHQGGFVLGSHDAQDWWLQRIAHEAGIAIVSVGYRLAPEHPYPAGLDDCVAAARWLMANAAELCPEPALLGIGGESAGANLAVTTMLRLRDESGSHPFQAAALTFGWYDVGLRLPSMQAWGDRDVILSVPVMQAFADHYRAPNVDDPYVSPLHADLRDMPPACFIVGDLDPLLSDTEQLEQQWRQAGGETELHVYSDAFHSFTAVPTLALGRRATSAAIAFLRDKIGVGAAVPVTS